MVVVDENLVNQSSQNQSEVVPSTDTPLPQDDVPMESTTPMEDGLTDEDGEQVLAPLPVTSVRNNVRILICTQSLSLLTKGSLMERRILELGELFAEVHVIVLMPKVRGEERMTVRLSETVWVYTTASVHPLLVSYDAYRIATEQLMFGGGFRADLVIAEDPCESGLAGHFIAKKHGRPFQVHLSEDVFDPEWKMRDPHNWLRLHGARFLFKRSPSVRAYTEGIKRALLIEYPKLEERTEVFPVYYDLRAWRETVPEFDLKERYARFKFIILHISSMGARSHTKEVIEGVVPLMSLYPTIGLVIVGSGPLRGALEKLVSSLGMAGRIAFEPAQAEVLSHMKSAHVLIHLSEDSEEDKIVLEAASVKLPIIGLGTGIAGTLFTNGESAFLCEAPDPNAVSRYLRMFLNDNIARLQLGELALEAVLGRVEQDYDAYLRAYRASIERSL
jgi:glycosyltransferase involved in cell wall biosynthesis